MYTDRGFSGGPVVKNLPANAEDMGSVLRSRRSPGGGNGNLLQYSCLENSTVGGAWQATVHGAAKSQTTTKRVCTHTHTRMHVADSLCCTAETDTAV